MENWSDKYLLGITDIDEQHRGFFELFNHKPLSEMDRDEMALMLTQLNNYIKNHFKQEQELMKKSKYPDFENHLAEHKFFVQKITEMNQEFNYMNPLLYEKITIFMKKWFLSHIMASDKKYQEHVINYLNQQKHEQG